MTNRISDIRKLRGLTLQEVAVRAATTNQQISHLEQGRRRLTYEWMERLAEALSCHPLELLSNPPGTPDGKDAVLSVRERRLLELFKSLAEDEQEALLEAVEPMARFLRRAG